jgi:tRNA uridine 5-carbamoylmethylation protein Kti12
MITVVTGPPCAGKSTYVRGWAEKGDIIIDMDAMASAMTPFLDDEHDYPHHVRMVAREARKVAVRTALSIGQTMRENVWVIHTSPDRESMRRYRSFNARIKTIDPGRDVCLARLAERPKGQHVTTRRVIDDWYHGR